MWRLLTEMANLPLTVVTELITLLVSIVLIAPLSLTGVIIQIVYQV